MTQTIYQTEDEYGSIEVKENNGVRTLHFGSEPTQSSMSLEHPDNLHLDYAKAMMSFLLFKDLGNEDLLLIGLGGGSQAKYLLQHFSQCRIEAVEYRHSVAEIAHDYFGLPREKRLNVVIDDGTLYAKERSQLQPEFYSVIMLDVFDSQGMAQEICNVEFFDDCQKMLKKDGVLLVNLWCVDTEQFKQLFVWIGSLFDSKLLFLPIQGMVNVIGLFFHENTPIYSRRELQRRAIKLEKTYNLPFKQFLKDLITYNPNFIDRVTSK